MTFNLHGLYIQSDKRSIDSILLAPLDFHFLKPNGDKVKLICEVDDSLKDDLYSGEFCQLKAQGEIVYLVILLIYNILLSLQNM